MSDLRVIVVEPSGVQARIARHHLQALHIENILTARGGGEALELARREGADVVVSSMHLPDMTGVQPAQVLHDDPRFSGIGFALASSDCKDFKLSTAPDAPPIALLPKPIDTLPLAQSLAQATGRVLEEILR
jgi:two-component system chemotaxis response regulator CheY